MLGYELGISGFGSDRSANCATTAAHFEANVKVSSKLLGQDAKLLLN